MKELVRLYFLFIKIVKYSKLVKTVIVSNSRRDKAGPHFLTATEYSSNKSFTGVICSTKTSIEHMSLQKTT